jgi:hypothetical protein
MSLIVISWLGGPAVAAIDTIYYFSRDKERKKYGLVAEISNSTSLQIKKLA